MKTIIKAIKYPFTSMKEFDWYDWIVSVAVWTFGSITLIYLFGDL